MAMLGVGTQSSVLDQQWEYSTQTKEGFRVTEEGNSKEPWMKAKGHSQDKAFIGDELSNEWTAKLLQFSRLNAKILVGLRTMK